LKTNIDKGKPNLKDYKITLIKGCADKFFVWRNEQVAGVSTLLAS